jgi:hypothetical protein
MMNTVWVSTFIAFTAVYLFTLANLSTYNTVGTNIPWPKELLVNDVYPSADINFYYMPISMAFHEYRTDIALPGVDI